MFFSRKKKSSKPANGSNGRIQSEPSFIGRDTTIEGQVTSEGELHIDGTVRGTVRAHLCVIDVDGVIEGDVSGDIVHVRGRVHGPIQGSNVYIHAGAHVEGDVFHDTISIENGAYVYGSIRHNSAPAPMAPRGSLFQSPLGAGPLLSPQNLPPLAGSTSATDKPADGTPDDNQTLRVIHSRK